MIALAAGCGDGKPLGSPTMPVATTVPTGIDLSGAQFVDHTAAKKVEVDAVDNNFQDQYVTVKAGTTVVFRNAGHNEHNLTPAVAGSFAGASTPAFEPGVEHTVTFTTAGDYPYYCSLHGTTTKGMTGAIRVVS